MIMTILGLYPQLVWKTSMEKNLAQILKGAAAYLKNYQTKRENKNQ